ncbi:ribosome-associated toxin RatA of RatAB toxin-antitoxin module [Rhodococcus sp. SMB37]|uniref:SRPBCC family protein n=1 Tax=Rhodococcus sp. SMB37 TaxID=2512213 RepID=UPI0006CF9061|nr:SRPBCC family protein [Rhodococcus sp. SMB37]TCN49874.1 ribosome-associated toxin RatA of RatAB toxin-antitoxin module [Rhodococcus sp. SMB37]
MIEVHHTAVAEVPVDVAFDYIDDHRTVPDWMFGVVRFEPVGAQIQGLGATFDATMRVGPKNLDSRVEIVEWEHRKAIVLSSISGFRTSSSWRFTELDDRQARLDVVFGYELPGGLAGRALGKLIEPIVGTAVRQTEQALRVQLTQLA